MAEPFTVRFGSVVSTQPVPVALFVAQPGFTYILRDLILWNHSVSTSVLGVWLIVPGQGNVILGWALSAAPDTGIHLDVRQAIEPGEGLNVYSSANNWTAIATGYRFTGAPPVISTLPGSSQIRTDL